MIRCVIYARYSSDNQHETSIEAQIDACSKFAKEQGWIVVKTYEDRAFTATNDNRPAFQEMLYDSKNKEFEKVVVHKLDRFARNVYDQTFNERKLNVNGVQLISVLEKIDSSPEGQLMKSVIVGFNAFYSENVKREAMKGLTVQAKKAIHCGGIPPLGLDVDPTSKRLVVNEKEAIIVREIFELFALGHGYKSIAHILNSKGYKTKPHVEKGHKGEGKVQTEFGQNSIYTILRNKKYIGTFVFNRVPSKTINGKRNSTQNKPPEEIIEIPDAITPIIEKELFEKVQKILESNKRDPKVIAAGYGAKEDYLLAGKIFCTCGSKMSGNRRFSGRSKLKYLTYRCTKRNQKGPTSCTAKEIRKEYLEDWVIDELLTNVLSKDMLPVILKKLNDYRNNKSGSYKSTFEGLKKNLRDVEKEIDNLLIMASQVTSSSLAKRLVELEEKKANISIEIEKFKVKLIENNIDEKLFENIVREIKTYIIEDNMKQLKNVVQMFVEKVLISEDTVEVIFTLACLLYFSFEGNKIGSYKNNSLFPTISCGCDGGGEGS